MTDASRRLLVLRLSALGDVIHTIPAVVALRQALPGTTISWAVEEPYRELVELVAGVETIPVRMKRWGRAPLASRKDAGAALRAIRRADASVDFQGLIKSAALGWLSGASTRYGFARAAIREKPALLFINRQIPVDPAKHVVEQNLQLAAGIAGTLPPVHPEWDRFPADPEHKLAACRGAIVFLPGAGKPNKLWPIERFRQLAAALKRPVVTVWGPAERALAEAIGAPMAPPTNLRELAFALRHAALVIGGDTGPLHLAAALGTKVVGLYGPTDPHRNGPYGQLDRCVVASPSAKWMESISVEEVVTTVARVLAE
ncbi:MAG: heptosyltransferase [Acidobacteriota bacterium]|jgi:lipopolysaccharide heptosyltransferase I|nr:heptosyltransferase [Acidobacteriota bacterium]